jgi:hypothetical protein
MMHSLAWENHKSMIRYGNDNTTSPCDGVRFLVAILLKRKSSMLKSIQDTRRYSQRKHRKKEEDV